MKKSNFDQLLQRYLEGNVSEKEKIKIEAWLDTLKTEETTHLELSAEDEEKLFQKISSKLDNTEEVINFHYANDKQSSKWLLRIAASLLILITASFVVWYVTSNNLTGLEGLSQQKVEKMILNDGTIVWLRGSSKLVYYEKPDQGLRLAELTGEALFEVTKDPGRPFLVHYGTMTVKVLGTSFSLKTNQDNLELTLLTGKVNLSSVTDSIGVDVEPYQKVIYNGHTAVKEDITQNLNELSAITENTEYRMQFSNATMEEVAEKIERKFNVNISMAEKKAASCRITADFTDQSLEATLEMITEVLDLTYSRTGNEITLNGNGCN